MKSLLKTVIKIAVEQNRPIYFGGRTAQGFVMACRLHGIGAWFNDGVGLWWHGREIVIRIRQ